MIEKNIKKTLNKPLKRKDKQKMKVRDEAHERAFTKRAHQGEKKKAIKIVGLIGVFVVALVLILRYTVSFDLGRALEPFTFTSCIISAALVLGTGFILVNDRTDIASKADPITDYFIIRRGKYIGSTMKRHFDRINTRFLMITFLKLYQKQELAIVDERIIYGAMDSEFSKDESLLLNFLLDHQVTTIDEFLEVISSEPHHKDAFYRAYKASIVQMAEEKGYINQAIDKGKWLLRSGGIGFGLLVLFLLSKGQGSLLLLSVLGLQSIGLILMANITYANSKGAHKRITAIRKSRKTLLSKQGSVEDTLIYHYIFNKEDKALKRIHKRFEQGTMTHQSYQKFSETYNSITFMMDFIKLENRTKPVDLN